MSKITYEDKIGVEPKTIRINQVQDDDMNLIKEVVNDNDECSVSSGYPILNDKTSAGRRYGSWQTPLTGAITLNPASAQEGGVSVVVWYGSSNPNIIGGTIQSYSGEIVQEGTYSIYFHYLDGRYNVTIFNVEGNPPLPSNPNQMTITDVSDSGSFVPPSQMTITEII